MGGTELLIVAQCGVEPRQGSMIIDRKFHVGMLEYARRLSLPVACLLPSLDPGEGVGALGAIDVRDSDIPYRVARLSRHPVTADDRKAIGEAVERAALVYLGHSEWMNIEVAAACRSRSVPYVAVSEYSLRTELDVMRALTPSAPRRVVRSLRLRWMDRKKRYLVAHAAELHANGYPTFDELAAVNPRRFLFFDTRSTEAMVIPEETLTERFESRQRRPARLIYSGRYHAMKGALHVVEVGIELARLGLDFHLDLYGAGPLRDSMIDRIRGAGVTDRIKVHDPVPFDPDLVAITRGADVFVGCHVQGDPSCTYLETFACGVPIVGYANEMWTPLCRDSGGGVAVESRRPADVASAIIGILTDDERLRAASIRARRFALANTMERAFDLRCARLEALAAAAART